MPNTLLNLHSAQRKVRIPDRPDGYGLRGRLSGKVPGGEVTWTPGRLRWNAIPDTYELRIEIPEFKRSKAKFTVGKKASDQKILIPSRCTKLPTYGQLETWQRRLLRTIGRAKKGSQIWARLSDNQRATFFQVTYALGKYQLKNGTMLSEYIRRVVRLGGSEMIGTHPKKPNKKVTGRRLAHPCGFLCQALEQSRAGSFRKRLQERCRQSASDPQPVRLCEELPPTQRQSEATGHPAQGQLCRGYRSGCRRLSSVGTARRVQEAGQDVQGREEGLQGRLAWTGFGPAIRKLS